MHAGIRHAFMQSADAFLPVFCLLFLLPILKLYDLAAHAFERCPAHTSDGSKPYHNIYPDFQSKISPVDAAKAPVRLLLVFLNMPCCFCEAASSLNCDVVLTITIVKRVVLYFSNVTACLYQLDALYLNR